MPRAGPRPLVICEWPCPPSLASGARQALLEPVVRVRLVVERGDLAIAGAPIELDGLGEGAIGLEVDDRGPRVASEPLELLEEPPRNPESASFGGDPHSFQLGWFA